MFRRINKAFHMKDATFITGHYRGVVGSCSLPPKSTHIPLNLPKKGLVDVSGEGKHSTLCLLGNCLVSLNITKIHQDVAVSPSLLATFQLFV